MSLKAAIDLAIRLQLAVDRPAVAERPARILGGDNATGYEFTEQTIGKFLRGVSTRLKLDDPPVIYDWTRSKEAQCLLADRDTLIDLIMRDTIRASGG